MQKIVHFLAKNEVNVSLFDDFFDEKGAFYAFYKFVIIFLTTL
ncbi:hypothetical protein SPONL_2235 [uncultured Candidatus Thioglobus sp.]|nr:hypothetical protein SPONL_2235 [uncultured Candidatus Thioglobus sp.]